MRHRCERRPTPVAPAVRVVARVAPFVAGLALAAVAAAHPYHVTLAEAEVNRETGRLEVALQVLPLDLQRALSLRLEHRVDLDREPGLEQLVASYLAEVFSLRDVEGRAAHLRWVGMQLDLRDAWLYFELELPDELTGAVLSNRIFFELEESQVNTVNLRLPAAEGGGTEVRTLRFTRERPSAPVE